MFTNSRSIDDRATAASFDTAYQKYAAATDSWFDGSPFSVDNRLAQCRRLMNLARAHVARRGAEVGPLTRLAELESDARALVALREDLLTGGFDREDTSRIAGVHVAVSGPLREDEDGLAPWEAADKEKGWSKDAKGKCECWEGYERVPGTKPCAEGSCRKCDSHRKAMRLAADGAKSSDAYEEPDEYEEEWLRKNAPEGTEEWDRRKATRHTAMPNDIYFDPHGEYAEATGDDGYNLHINPAVRDRVLRRLVEEEASRERKRSVANCGDDEPAIGNEDDDDSRHAASKKDDLKKTREEYRKQVERERKEKNFSPNDPGGWRVGSRDWYFAVGPHDFEPGRDYSDGQDWELKDEDGYYGDFTPEDFCDTCGDREGEGYHGELPNGFGEHPSHKRAGDDVTAVQDPRYAALSPQDRRFVTLESSRFLSANTDTNDARELATRAMHHAQKVTSTYDRQRSAAVTSAFVQKVASGAEQRRRTRPVPPTTRTASVTDLPPEALFF